MHKPGLGLRAVPPMDLAEMRSTVWEMLPRTGHSRYVRPQKSVFPFEIIFSALSVKMFLCKICGC